MIFSNRIRKLGMGTLAFGATLFTAAVLEAAIIDTAQAAEPRQVISLRGLDMQRPADVAVAYERIHRAAEAVCGTEAATGSHLRSIAQERCISESVDSAVVAIDRKELTAFHRQALAGQPAAHPGA